MGNRINFNFAEFNFLNSLGEKTGETYYGFTVSDDYATCFRNDMTKEEMLKITPRNVLSYIASTSFEGVFIRGEEIMLEIFEGIYFNDNYFAIEEILKIYEE